MSRRRGGGGGALVGQSSLVERPEPGKTSLPRSGKIDTLGTMSDAVAGLRSGQLSSVRNAARLLKEFSRHDHELGVTEVARRIGVTTSTAFRLLTTLTAEGLLERGETEGRYRLGMVMYELGVTVFPQSGLHEAAVPVLAALRHSTGETVQLAVLDHLEVVFIDRLESPQTLRFVSGVGHRIPAHATSTGKVLLAALDRGVLRERLRDRQLARLTPFTIVSKRALSTDLARVAERGWAQNVEESTLGTSSVAAPIVDSSGQAVAALSVVAPVFRATPEAMRGYRAAAVNAASVISRRLGYDGGRAAVTRS